MVAVGVSVTLAVTVGALGASAAVPPGGVGPGGPPHAAADPSPYLVTGLLAACVVVGVVGLLLCALALRRGWQPGPRRMMAAAALAVAALVVVPSTGSADPESYAAYGHLAVTGHDPYAVAPSHLNDAYGRAVEPPWRDTTSVYGPVATGEQMLAAWIAGDSPARAVWLLAIGNGLAFLGAGALLVGLARDDGERRRAALLWSLNPLLLLEVVGGAHLDALVVLGCVAALAAARRSGAVGWALAGVAGGAACAVKATAGLVGAALAWGAAAGEQAGWRPKWRPKWRQRWRPSPRGPEPAPGARLTGVRLVTLAVGAAVVLVPSYVLAGGHAFDQLGVASGFVSFASPWRLVMHPLEVALGHDPARILVRTAGWVAAAVLAVCLARGLPRRNRPAEGGADLAIWASAVLVLGWLLTAPYVLPWYDALGWALLALLPWSALDVLLVIRTAVLALAYLPGRDVTLPGPLHAALDAWKSGVSPAVLALVAIVAAVVTWKRRAAVV